MKKTANESKHDVEYLPPKDSIKVAGGPVGGPAPVPPLVYNSGPIMSGPQFISFYWGPFASTDINAMQAWLAGYAGYLNGVGVPVGEEQVLQQYGVSGATVGPY